MELLEGSAEWYWGTDCSQGDLYEAEEIFKQGYPFKENNLIFVHFPNGEVIEPIKAEKGQYFGVPIFENNNFILLVVDFPYSLIKLLKYSIYTKKIEIITELPLKTVDDCYNLLLKQSPLMLIREGHDNIFQIIYPEQSKFDIGDNESFCYREENMLFFSAWYEDSEYHEEVNVRDLFTGKITDKFAGSINFMPNGQKWILTD